jgi:hypothetical protein
VGLNCALLVGRNAEELLQLDFFLGVLAHISLFGLFGSLFRSR